jgi:hypothetical protein
MGNPEENHGKSHMIASGNPKKTIEVIDGNL